MSIVPFAAVLTKADTVVVKVNDSAGKPAEGVFVFLNEQGVYFGLSFGPTDSLGKVSCNISGEYGPGDVLEITQMVGGNVVGPALGIVTLGSQGSGEIAVKIKQAV